MESSNSNIISQGKPGRPDETAATLAVASIVLVLTLICLSAYTLTFGMASVIAALLVWTAMASCIWHFSYHHEHKDFGHANAATTARAMFTAGLAGLIPIAAQIPTNAWFWSIAIVATITLCLDGLDGYLARKNNSCSAFGARFDMEIDAFLALVITLFLWQSGRAGVWILGLGLMRYAFIAAAYWLTYLNADLYPSMRRKAICVIQIGALCLMLIPLLSTMQATFTGLVALACLTYSFSIDVLWLFRNHRTASTH